MGMGLSTQKQPLHWKLLPGAGEDFAMCWLWLCVWCVSVVGRVIAVVLVVRLAGVSVAGVQPCLAGPMTFPRGGRCWDLVMLGPCQPEWRGLRQSGRTPGMEQGAISKNRVYPGRGNSRRPCQPNLIKTLLHFGAQRPAKFQHLAWSPGRYAAPRQITPVCPRVSAIRPTRLQGWKSRSGQHAKPENQHLACQIWRGAQNGGASGGWVPEAKNGIDSMVVCMCVVVFNLERRSQSVPDQVFRARGCVTIEPSARRDEPAKRTHSSGSGSLSPPSTMV